MKIFKIIVTALSLFFFVKGIAQENGTIVFSYDAGGNLTERKLQVMVGGRMARPNLQQADSTVIVPVNFKIFPNPANDYLNLEGDLPEGISEAKVQIMNMNGTILKTDNYNGSLKQIAVSDLTKGIYVLEMVYTKKKRASYKIIID